VLRGQKLYRRGREGVAEIAKRTFVAAAKECLSVKLCLQEFLLWTKMVDSAVFCAEIFP
jgi:hypothetical protein